MLLASQGDVPLGQRNGFGVLALAVELAHLGTEGIKVIGALRLRSHAAGGRQQRRQDDQRRPAPQPSARHHNPLSTNERGRSVRGRFDDGKGVTVRETFQADTRRGRS